MLGNSTHFGCSSSIPKHEDRHRRLRYIKAGVGRRKVGRAKTKELEDKRKLELLGIRGYVLLTLVLVQRCSQGFSAYCSVITIKIRSLDPERTDDDGVAESLAWIGVNEHTRQIFRPDVATEEVAQAAAEYIDELKRRINDLCDEFNFVVDKPEFDSVQKIERVTHHYRRLVAGYHQVVELVEPGERSLAAALEDEMIIFEGQR